MEHALAQLLKKAHRKKLTQRELTYVQTIAALCSRIYGTMRAVEKQREKKKAGVR